MFNNITRICSLSTNLYDQGFQPLTAYQKRIRAWNSKGQPVVDAEFRMGKMHGHGKFTKSGTVYEGHSR
jgi:hypothetical protein